MWRDKKEMRCSHTIEVVIEILSRSPHNRVLLRYNDFGRILLIRLKSLSSEIAALSASDESYIAPFSFHMQRLPARVAPDSDAHHLQLPAAPGPRRLAHAGGHLHPRRNELIGRSVQPV